MAGSRTAAEGKEPADKLTRDRRPDSQLAVDPDREQGVPQDHVGGRARRRAVHAPDRDQGEIDGQAHSHGDGESDRPVALVAGNL